MAKSDPCPQCLGTGTNRTAQEIGAEMRALREAAGKSQKQVAENMNISQSFLCDLEKGARRFLLPVVNDFKKALKKK